MGIGIRFVSSGFSGAWRGLIALLGVVFVLFVFFVAHVLGAGDIKLLAMVGAFVGDGIWDVLLYTCICTGMTGVSKLMYEQKLGSRHPLGMREEKKGKHGIHMSIPIALGSVIFMAGGW